MLRNPNLTSGFIGKLQETNGGSISEKIRASFIKKITPLIGRKEETENARAQWTSLLKEPVSL